MSNVLKWNLQQTPFSIDYLFTFAQAQTTEKKTTWNFTYLPENVGCSLSVIHQC